MKNKINILLCCCMFLIVGICTANPESGGNYFIQSAMGNNNQFLNVKNGNPARGTRINLAGFNNTISQYFTLVDAGDDYYYIISNTIENRALEVANSHRGRNGTIILGNRINQDSFKWRFTPVEGREGFYNIQSKLGTFLSASRNPQTDERFVATNPRRDTNTMQWKLNITSEEFTFTKQYTVDNIRDLCPTTLMKGDREFSGNGPNITGRIFLTYDERSVYALVTFNAKETKADWSEVRGEWIKNIINTPSNWRINRILSDNHKGFYKLNITSPSSGYALESGTQFHENSAVSRMWIRGDTGGDDISSNKDCSDDTAIRFIEFKPIIIEFTYLNLL